MKPLTVAPHDTKTSGREHGDRDTEPAARHGIPGIASRPGPLKPGTPATTQQIEPFQ